MKIKKTKQNTGLVTDEIVISATEPSDINKKKVWFKNKKNLFDGTLIGGTIGADGILNTDYANTRVRSSDYISIDGNEIYSITADSDKSLEVLVGIYDENYSYITEWDKNSTWMDIGTKIKTPSNSKYMIFVFRNKNTEGNISISDINNINIRKENNSAIYIKNDNQYEEFIKEGEIITIENSLGRAILYPDGTMICTKKITATNVNLTTTLGSLYVTDSDIALGNFPFEFVDIPTMNITLFNSWIGFIIHNENFSKSSAGTIKIARTSSATNGTYHIAITAIGRWK